ncbi:unnamed protein product [Gongylonema pulchrum]|uniref:G_PROTEIN_RECEP_F1_2 domain-containing protein n=1 Tax=Gongylonema pulchrum TaxID=637853 RepID=A0A183D4H5_9BILA|nr:unnamed protein product [Gongylonema pulchrum]
MFHCNLIALFLNTEATQLLCLITRLLIILSELGFPVCIDVEHFYDVNGGGQKNPKNFSAMFSLAVSLISIVAERTASTLLVRKYEKFCARIPYLGLAIITVQWTICLAALIALHDQSGPWITKLISSVIYTCHGAALLVFLLLPYVSKRIVQKEMDTHDLSIRYQSVENMRSANLLRACIAIIAVLSNIANTCVLLTTIVPPEYTTLCIFIFYTTAPTQVSSQIYTYVKINLKQKFR